jgi:hypothetical protein
MYTDYDAEIYFLTDNSLSPNGINSDQPPSALLSQTAEMKLDERDGGWLASGTGQQPGLNTQSKGDAS